MIAERTLVGCFSNRVDITRAVGTSLYAVSTPNARRAVNENDAISSYVGGANRARLHAGRLLALITKLGYKKCPEDALLFGGCSKAVLSTIWTIDRDRTVLTHRIPLDPGAEIERFIRDFVFRLAGIYATTAPNAPVNIDTHSIQMILWFICVAVPGKFGLLRFRSGERERDQQ